MDHDSSGYWKVVLDESTTEGQMAVKGKDKRAGRWERTADQRLAERFSLPSVVNHYLVAAMIKMIETQRKQLRYLAKVVS